MAGEQGRKGDFDFSPLLPLSLSSQLVIDYP